MKDLSVQYLGLKLKNPVIVGSCGLTSSVAKIRDLAENNAGAVVLKSLFEEQIQAELSSNLQSYNTDSPEAWDYVRNYTRGNALQEYISLISEAKQSVDIPVIASINCVSDSEWMSFTKSVEQAGADAIELNISLLSSNPRITCQEIETLYFTILDKACSSLSIPITLKMSKYSSSFANLVTRLSWKSQIGGFVLFNRWLNIDIDINQQTVTSADIFKQLLAGATAVQVVSTLYNNGPSQINTLLDGLEKWMEEQSYNSVKEFRGKLSQGQSENPAVFERIQFMKYYGGIG
jgi:dihydroorotate dehydrogenase (fumarate)